jgi:hypothetical protein
MYRLKDRPGIRLAQADLPKSPIDTLSNWVIRYVVTQATSEDDAARMAAAKCVDNLPLMRGHKGVLITEAELL